MIKEQERKPENTAKHFLLARTWFFKCGLNGITALNTTIRVKTCYMDYSSSGMKSTRSADSLHAGAFLYNEKHFVMRSVLKSLFSKSLPRKIRRSTRQANQPHALDRSPRRRTARCDRLRGHCGTSNAHAAISGWLGLRTYYFRRRTVRIWVN
jgi:hypothetical protein